MLNKFLFIDIDYKKNQLRVGNQLRNETQGKSYIETEGKCHTATNLLYRITLLKHWLMFHKRRLLPVLTVIFKQTIIILNV